MTSCGGKGGKGDDFPQWSDQGNSKPPKVNGPISAGRTFPFPSGTPIFFR